MEVIGGVASFLTLIEAAAVIGSTTAKLCLNVRDAPKEVSRVKSHLLNIRRELELLHLLQADRRIPVHFATPEANELFAHALRNAEETIQALQEACQRSCDKSSSHNFRWALLDRKKVTKLLEDLQRLETSLSNVFHSLSM